MSQVRRNVVQRKDTPEVAAPSIPTDQVGWLRDRTWALADEWEKAGWPWLAAVLKGATALTKGER